MQIWTKREQEREMGKFYMQLLEIFQHFIYLFIYLFFTFWYEWDT